MPLFENARDLIRANLERFQPRVIVHVQAVALGMLTEVQLVAINANRAADGAVVINQQDSARLGGTWLRTAGKSPLQSVCPSEYSPLGESRGSPWCPL